MVFLTRIMILVTTCLFLLAVVPTAEAANDQDTDAAANETSIDHTPTYHIYDDIDLVSTIKFHYGKSKVVIKDVYPQLASDTDNESVNNFNQLVTQILQAETDHFKSQVADRQSAQKKLGKINNDLYVDYDTSFLKMSQGHVLSVRFSVQGYVAGMAHPYHYHRSINYNLDTNQPIELNDLFLPDAAYLQFLSTYTSDVLTKRLQNKDMIAAGTAPTPENFSIWNLKANGILITFDEYKVAPYSDGAQTVLVPYSALEDILAPNSPISSCIDHHRKCTSNNLLTGGFIDEA